MRYKLVSDDSGHKYACPLEQYWPANDDEFENFNLPSNVLSIDGRFTFSDPRNE